ncbi:MAG: hypothetical protein AB9819_04050 [Methanomassiliicoccales archaeon]
MNDRSKKQRDDQRTKKAAKEHQRELAKLAKENAEIEEAARNAICSDCNTKCILKEDPLKPFCPKCDRFVTLFYTK